MAKSISAYDMAVSDAVYGKSDRYVSMGRLQAMLDHEYELNLERLDATRGHDNAFFAFADTVVARSYAGGNECHGWMGVKFQSHQRDEPSQIVLHVRMFGPDGHVLQPSEVLRKKAILVERGSFRPPTAVNIDMLAAPWRSSRPTP